MEGNVLRVPDRAYVAKTNHYGCSQESESASWGRVVKGTANRRDLQQLGMARTEEEEEKKEEEED